MLEIIRDTQASPFGAQLAIKDVTSWFIDRHGYILSLAESAPR